MLADERMRVVNRVDVGLGGVVVGDNDVGAARLFERSRSAEVEKIEVKSLVAFDEAIFSYEQRHGFGCLAGGEGQGAKCDSVVALLFCSIVRGGKVNAECAGRVAGPDLPTGLPTLRSSNPPRSSGYWAASSQSQLQSCYRIRGARNSRQPQQPENEVSDYSDSLYSGAFGLLNRAISASS